MGFGAVRPNPLGGATPPGGGATIGPNGQPVFHGPQTYNPNPNMIGGGYGPPGPGSTNKSAVAGAKLYRDTLGLPSWQDLLGKLGGQGTTEFGNAGAAGTGADFMRGELADWKGNLAAQRGQLTAQRNQINAARFGIKNPTRTSAFRDVMRLSNERLGNAVENDRRLAAEAASKRGFVGGYNPEATDRARLESLATAGYEAAGEARKSAQDQFGNEVSLLGQEGNIYGTNLAGYNAALGGYTDLTKTLAELPTKYLTAYSSLLGGLGGGFGDIFGTSSRNVQFDVENQRSDAARRRQDRVDMRNRMLNTPGAAGFA